MSKTSFVLIKRYVWLESKDPAKNMVELWLQRSTSQWQREKKVNVCLFPLCKSLSSQELISLSLSNSEQSLELKRLSFSILVQVNKRDGHLAASGEQAWVKSDTSFQIKEICLGTSHITVQAALGESASWCPHPGSCLVLATSDNASPVPQWWECCWRSPQSPYQQAMSGGEQNSLYWAFWLFTVFLLLLHYFFCVKWQDCGST